MTSDIEYFKNYGLSGLYKELKKATKDNVDKLKEECEQHHGGSGPGTEPESITIDEIEAMWNDSDQNN